MMIAYATEKVGPPAGREGQNQEFYQGYTFAQSQELIMHSLDFLALTLDATLKEISKNVAN